MYGNDKCHCYDSWQYFRGPILFIEMTDHKDPKFSDTFEIILKSEFSVWKTNLYFISTGRERLIRTRLIRSST